MVAEVLHGHGAFLIRGAISTSFAAEDPTFRTKSGIPSNDYATRHLDDDQRATVSHAYVRGLIQPVTDLMTQAVATGELREADPGFLATAFMELAATVHPPQDDCTPAAADHLAQDVVDLFLRGAGPAPTTSPS
ncbi:hypothetical protein [Streptomyces sp. NPDC002913]